MDVARKAGQNIPAEVAEKLGSEPTGSIHTSLQNLGLKLEPRKSPMTLIVVDKVEKTPTDN